MRSGHQGEESAGARDGELLLLTHDLPQNAAIAIDRHKHGRNPAINTSSSGAAVPCDILIF